MLAGARRRLRGAHGGGLAAPAGRRARAPGRARGAGRKAGPQSRHRRTRSEPARRKRGALAPLAQRGLRQLRGSLQRQGAAADPPHAEPLRDGADCGAYCPGEPEHHDRRRRHGRFTGGRLPGCSCAMGDATLRGVQSGSVWGRGATTAAVISGAISPSMRAAMQMRWRCRSFCPAAAAQGDRGRRAEQQAFPQEVQQGQRRGLKQARLAWELQRSCCLIRSRARWISAISSSDSRSSRSACSTSCEREPLKTRSMNPRVRRCTTS
jgi:hypothetical protein